MATTTCLQDRRQGFRIPIGGTMLWSSRNSTGEGILVDISPRGVAFEVSLADALRIGPTVKLEMELTEDMLWCVTENGRVVRKVRAGPDRFQIAASFCEYDCYS